MSRTPLEKIDAMLEAHSTGLQHNKIPHETGRYIQLLHNPVTRDQFITVQLVVRLQQFNLNASAQAENKTWFGFGAQTGGGSKGLFGFGAVKKPAPSEESTKEESASELVKVEDKDADKLLDDDGK